MSKTNGTTKRNTSKKGNRSRNRSRNCYKQPEFNKETSTNDVTWYAQEPALLRDSASIPFSWSVGTPIDLSNPVLQTLTSKGQFSVPGICALSILPNFGQVTLPTDPLNTAAFSIYSYVRHANSGHSNYDAPDLMLYLLAMSQVYSFINSVQRIYGAATMYSQRNRYMPQALLTAMGVDFNSVTQNLADFRYRLNALINKAASLYVPNNMPIFNRHASLFQNIYIEGNSLKDQMYLFVPDAFYAFTLNPEDNYAGMLQPVAWLGNSLKTVDDIFKFGDNLLDRLIQSEDMNIMSGDILKAYGQDGLMKLATVPEQYPLVPIFDPSVLEQMKNATVLTAVQGLEIKQSSNKGWLLSKPCIHYADTDSYAHRAIAYSLNSYTEKRLLTVAAAEVTPENIMEATRLMIVPDEYIRVTESEAVVNFKAGSEICTACRFYYYKFDGTSWDLTHLSVSYLLMNDVSDESNVALIHKFNCIMSNFKYRPAVRIVAFRPGAQLPAFQLAESFINFDVDNYAVVNADEINRMHEAALLSEFNVPRLARV